MQYKPDMRYNNLHLTAKMSKYFVYTGNRQSCWSTWRKCVPDSPVWQTTFPGKKKHPAFRTLSRWQSACTHLHSVNSTVFSNNAYITPSFITVRNGGQMFETFLGGFTGRQTNRLFYKLVKQHNADSSVLVTPMSDADNKILMDNNRDCYYGFLLFGMQSNTSKSMCLSFNFSFSLNYFGLSRNGIKLMGEFGYGMKMSTFDTYKKKLIRTEAKTVK